MACQWEYICDCGDCEAADVRNALATELRGLVGFLRNDEHWPVKAEHMALLLAAEAALAKAEGK